MNVILYRVRKIDHVVTRELRRLRDEARDHDLWAVGYAPHGTDYVITGDAKVFETNQDSLKTLPYPEAIASADWNAMTGCNYLPVFEFYRAHREYDYYWVIEDDVRYTGDWADFFSELDRSPADLLTTSIWPREGHEGWFWWQTVKAPPGSSIAERHLHRCFAPIARLSRTFLATLHQAYSLGWNGHCEALFPTVCSVATLRMEDIGGHGPFVPDARRARFYTNTPHHSTLYPGTFVFRPSYRDHDILEFGHRLTDKPCLWHPVKWY